MRSNLYPDQEKGLYMVRSAYSAGERRICAMMPTAAGKTVTAAAIIDRALRKGKRVLFTVPAIQLVDQTIETLWSEGIRDIGVLQGRHPLTNPSMPVQVASTQTLARRAFPPVDLAISGPLIDAVLRRLVATLGCSCTSCCPILKHR